MECNGVQWDAADLSAMDCMWSVWREVVWIVAD